MSKLFSKISQNAGKLFNNAIGKKVSLIKLQQEQGKLITQFKEQAISYYQF